MPLPKTIGTGRALLGGGGGLLPFSDDFSGGDGPLGARWTGATWAVSGGAAVNTPTLGSDVVVNGGFDADANWTKGTGWSIAAGVATHAAGSAGNLSESNILTLGQWWKLTFTISGYVAGTVRASNSAGSGVARSADGTYTSTVRAISGASLAMVASSDFDGSVDNVSATGLTLSELFASVQPSTADVVADVNVTGPTATADIQAGLVLNLDSASSPANFVIAYLNGDGNAKLDKCVGGTYTNLINAAVTYSAGATLRVIKSGTSYWLFYNGSAVGTVQTVSDAGIKDNTLHGLFSTSPTNRLDDFSLVAA